MRKINKMGVVLMFCFVTIVAQAHNKVVVIPLGGEEPPAGETEVNDSAALATPLFKTLYSNKIFADIGFTDFDWYKTYVPEGYRVSANTDAGRTDGCGFFGADTEVEILDTDGATRIAFNDDKTPLILCSFTQTGPLSEGIYYVRVSASQQYCLLCVFDYSLTIEVFQ